MTLKKRIGIILLSVMLCSVISMVVSCQSESSTSDHESDVRAYADPATETTLTGLSENDLAKYTRYGNDEFKAALTQEVFDTAASQINAQFGSYESKDFLRIEEQQGYTVVYYEAKYTNTDVTVKMVFDEDHLVAGQWFE